MKSITHTTKYYFVHATFTQQKRLLAFQLILAPANIQNKDTQYQEKHVKH